MSSNSQLLGRKKNFTDFEMCTIQNFLRTKYLFNLLWLVDHFPFLKCAIIANITAASRQLSVACSSWHLRN